MTISVIVPVYNVADKLERCVDSILSQTLTDYELLLIDDGSTDGSGELCDHLASTDARIRVLHQENGGVSAARNRGLDAAQGEYIAFVDSDDFVDADYLKVMYDTATLKNSELVICGVYYCDHRDVSRYTPMPDRGDHRIQVSPDSDAELAALIEDRRLNYVYAKLYRREMLFSHRLSFDESLSLGEDTVFVFACLRHIAAIDIIGASYYYYIKYPSGTLSSAVSAEPYARFTALNNRLEESLRQAGLWLDGTRTAVERRRILSAYWSLCVLWDMPLCKKEKIARTASLLKTPELTLACRDGWERKSDLPYAEEIRAGNARKFLSKMESDTLKNQFLEKRLAIARKLIPESVRQWIKTGKHTEVL